MYVFVLNLKDFVFSLCCAGDYLEVVEPGNPPKRTVYVVVWLLSPVAYDLLYELEAAMEEILW